MTAINMAFWGVITFSLLVLIHEGGHFLAARLFRVKVHEFMIGLPSPRIALKTKSTTYGITAIPLGGYVKIAGMEPGAEDPRLANALAAITDARRMTAPGLAQALTVPTEDAEKLLTTLQDWGAIEPAEDDEVSWVATMERTDGESDTALLDRARSVTYRGRKTWQRLTMLAAGVTVNLVAAILTFTIVFALFGYYEPSLTIDQVSKNSGAAAAGLKAGDRLVRVDDRALDGWDDLIAEISTHKPGERVQIVYVRDGLERTAAAKLTSVEGQPKLGVGPTMQKKEFTVFTGFVESLRWTGQVFVAILDFFRPATFRQSLEGARSVIGISEVVAQAVESGPLDYAWLVAFLSLSLGVMNILPIPPLDGGKAVMEIVEHFLGRPIKREVYLAISASGAILLFTLIAYLMYADVVRIVTQG